MKMKLLALATFATSMAHAQTAPILNGFVSAATPTQEKVNPTITTGKVPMCITTFRLVTKPVTAQKLAFRVRCNNITNVTGVHIHGPADADNNAGILVGLFAGPTTGAVDGILVSGAIDRATFPGGVAAYDSLIANMRADMTYVNVHTDENTGGEVRGQISATELPNNPGLLF